ncbi:telomere repeat-binding factor 3-like isoform X2 [Raphanus sativus]|uniref:MYB transcription factor n=1 Tax=Raphanus sativus TaxID=3726 RepID=A0A9W3BXH2_RAPSA|nr:telomere repeat-binding factor 3-like isoform X2 [Raphanus sativus]
MERQNHRCSSPHSETGRIIHNKQSCEMGGPKQMWTPKEEKALRDGVREYGAGKWRGILSDSKYGLDLKARSNVDLKDKWRNIGAGISGSRKKKAKIAFQNQDEDDDTALAIVAVANDDNGEQEIVPASPANDNGGEQQIVPASPVNDDDEGLFTSVDTFILEAITSWKKLLLPNKKSILLRVEEKNNMEPGMKRLVASRLTHLVNVGTIIRKNNRYKIAPTYAAAEAEQNSPQLLLVGSNENGVKKQGEAFKINGMTEKEASAAAAKALEEAEFARAEAEEAAREADRAEAEAEAMQDYAVAVKKVWNDWMHGQTWW